MINEFLQVKQIVQERKSVLDRMMKMVNDDVENIDFFRHDKKYIVERHLEKQLQWEGIMHEFNIVAKKKLQLEKPLCGVQDLAPMNDNIIPTLNQ